MSRPVSFFSTRSVGLSPVPLRADATLHHMLVISAVLAGAFIVGLAFAYLSPARPIRAPSVSRDRRLTLTVAGWIIGMFSIVCVYFWLGFSSFIDATVAPGNAYEIRAISSSGRWTFEYPSGKTSLNQLMIPVSQPVALRLSSADQVHDLYLPRLRVKQSAIPGRYTSTWFQSNQVFSARIECVTFCPRVQGAVASLHVLTPSQFDEWLSATREKKDPRNVAIPKKGSP